MLQKMKSKKYALILSVSVFIGFQIVVAESMEVSQPIVSNVVKFVTGKIIDKAPLWIQAITCQVTSICFR
jgi:hypothetical protein